VALLAEQFLAAICQSEGQQKRLSPAALVRLAAWRWPGNVRELRNVLQRAFVMTSGEVIDDEWLPRDASGAPATEAEAQASINIALGTSLADAEYQLIVATLRHFNNHKERTAAALGVSLKTLYNRLKEYANDRGGDELTGDDPPGLPIQVLDDGPEPPRRAGDFAALRKGWR
jgi:two-component system, NtrC family, response regulator AtoC